MLSYSYVQIRIHFQYFYLILFFQNVLVVLFQFRTTENRNSDYPNECLTIGNYRFSAENQPILHPACYYNL